LELRLEAVLEDRADPPRRAMIVIGESDAAGKQQTPFLIPASPKPEEVAWFQKLEDPSDSSMMLPQKNFSGPYGFECGFSRVG
jgi:hypothetical protein